MKYTYAYKTSDGVRHEDTMTASSREEVFSVLRAKGIVPAEDGGWIHFDYVPGESDVRRGGASVTGRICVIGSQLNEDALKEMFCLG